MSGFEIKNRRGYENKIDFLVEFTNTTATGHNDNRKACGKQGLWQTDQ